MGGAVKVIVRESNGTVTAMTRWTNSIPYWINRPEFIEDPEKLLKEYIAEKEKSDYYQPNATLSPEGYGLIVFDLQNKLILSCQDYCDLDRISGSGMSLDLNLHKTVNFKLQNSEIPYIDLEKLKKEFNDTNKLFSKISNSSDSNEAMAKAQRIYKLFISGSLVASKKYIKKLLNWDTKSQKDYLSFYERLGRKKKRSIDDWKFLLELLSKMHFIEFEVRHGLKVITFNNNQYDQFKRKLLDLNFKFKKSDLADWDEYTSTYV